jgi:TPR repeat protein
MAHEVFISHSSLDKPVADQGNASAQINLGLLHESGQGVTKDLDEAVKLYQKAADQGNEGAIANLKRLSGH